MKSKNSSPASGVPPLSYCAPALGNRNQAGCIYLGKERNDCPGTGPVRPPDQRAAGGVPPLPFLSLPLPVVFAWAKKDMAVRPPDRSHAEQQNQAVMFTQANTTSIAFSMALGTYRTPPGARKRSGKRRAAAGKAPFAFLHTTGRAQQQNTIAQALGAKKTPGNRGSFYHEISVLLLGAVAPFGSGGTPLTYWPWRRLRRRSRLLSWPGPRPSQSGRSS